MTDVNKIVFFGHHKCGSRFFRHIVLSQFAKLNDYNIVEYDIVNPPFHFYDLHDLDMKNLDFNAFKSPDKTLFNFTNSSSTVVNKVKALCQDFKGLHVIRDPRHVLASAYFHHLDGHGLDTGKWVWDRLIHDRKILETSSLEDGILYELDNISKDLFDNQIFAWQADERVLELKLEETKDIDAIVLRIQKFFNFEHRPLIEINNKTKRANPGSRHWSEVFTPKIKNVFKERYGEGLIRLGYAENNDW